MSKKNSLESKALRRELRKLSKTPRVAGRSGECPVCGRRAVLSVDRANLCRRCVQAFEAAMFVAALNTAREADNG